MREITLFLALGVIGAFVNLVPSYMKKWELLWTMTVAAGILTVVAFTVGWFVVGSGFFTSLIVFVCLLSILGMTAVALVVSAVQALISLRRG